MEGREEVEVGVQREVARKNLSDKGHDTPRHSSECSVCFFLVGYSAESM